MMVVAEKYTKVAVVLHWLISPLIITNVALGIMHDHVPDDQVRFVIDTHKSIGITVLGLAIMRILWRVSHKPPALPTTYQVWERKLSHAVHWLLYILMFALPITGWIHDSAWKAAPTHPMTLFGIVPWPRIPMVMNLDPVAKEQIHDAFGMVHGNLGLILIVVFFLHIAGALKHQFIDKEKELQRMWR
jgi:cytochrome b561